MELQYSTVESGHRIPVEEKGQSYGEELDITVEFWIYVIRRFQRGAVLGRRLNPGEEDTDEDETWSMIREAYADVVMHLAEHPKKVLTIEDVCAAFIALRFQKSQAVVLDGIAMLRMHHILGHKTFDNFEQFYANRSCRLVRTCHSFTEAGISC